MQLSRNSELIFKRRYAIHESETWQQLAIRVGGGGASVEKYEDVEKYTDMFADDIYNAIEDAISDFFDSLGSFICTGTVNVLGTKCGNELLWKLKTYRDETMNEAEGLEMLRYYAVLGPKVVKLISEDPDKIIIYKYLYSEYISKLEGMIERQEKNDVFILYFKMVDDMLERYDINPGKRYTKCRDHLMS